MTENPLFTNTPMFNARTQDGGYQEVWYLKCNAPDAVRALWLRFTILIRADHSKEIAEVWAIFFDRRDGRTYKTGIKNTWPLSEFQTVNTTGLRIHENSLLEDSTSGMVENDTSRIAWEFRMTPGEDAQQDFVPAALKRLGLVKNTALTIHEQWLFTGWCEVNGERFIWNQAPGMQGHLAGPKNGHSWAWGHCNCFVDESGAPASLVWDGLSARARLGNRATPHLTSMYVQLGRERFSMNTVRDALCTKSSYDFDGWEFFASKGGCRFAGRLTAQRDDFACVTYEDTDGSNLYCHNAKICDMTLEITQPGGRTECYTALGAAAYEVVTRERNPAILLVI